MLTATDSEYAPWYIVRSDDKKRARLNCTTHLPSRVSHKDPPPVIWSTAVCWNPGCLCHAPRRLQQTGNTATQTARCDCDDR
jgi:hypothetical protein